jgi:preprotein translocase subunit SecD
MLTTRRVFSLALAIGCLGACDQLAAIANRTGASVGDDGAYILLEVDRVALLRERLEAIAEQMAVALREASPAISFTGRGVVDDAARIRLVHVEDLPRAREALRALGGDVAVSDGAEGLVEARVIDSAVTTWTNQAILESLGVLQRRTQPMGIIVTRHSDAQIIARTANAEFPPEAKGILTKRARLTFNLVREIAPAEAAAGRIPPGNMLVQPYPGLGQYPEVVERRARFTGERLVRAQATADPGTQGFALAFQLDAEGTRLFCRVTRDHAGQRFAVLFDDEVLTAPRINEPICAGSGIISGFSPEEARDLATMLSAGALPAPLTIVAEGVGPAS